MKVRTRFAPSPTGLQHLGGIRTALFNWLWAKHNDGTFILRFEDTDQSRQVVAAEQHIIDALEWLGLQPDEGGNQPGEAGPYKQSQRLDIYQQHAEQLLEQGGLYRDWTPPEQLAAMRKEAQQAKQPFRVRQDMLDTDGDPNEPHVLRFKVDTQGATTWQDVIRSEQSVESEEIDDFVAIKSDGFPTYNFANVIDDHLMEISHVIRGDEFLSSTPKHLQVYQAFGWEPPQFAHIPPVLGPDKAKLSKRHGAQEALVYKKEGYLPAALLNFLAGLGWNDGTDQEIFSVRELIEKFTLERVQKSPAIFDAEKLKFINGVHIRQLELSKLYAEVQPFWPEAAREYDDEYKKAVLELVHERLKYFAELPELTDFFFQRPDVESTVRAHKEFKDGGKRWLEEALAVLKNSDFTKEDLEDTLRQLAQELKTKPGKLFGLLRIAISGKTVAPGLFETMHVLGKDEVNSRIQSVLDHLA